MSWSRFFVACVLLALALHIVGDPHDPFRDDWTEMDKAATVPASVEDIGSMGDGDVE